MPAAKFEPREIKAKWLDRMRKIVPAGERFEVFDTQCPGLSVRIGPRRCSWAVSYKLPGARGVTRYTIGHYDGSKESMDPDAARAAGKAALNRVHKDRVDLRHVRRQEKHAAERARENTFRAVAGDFMEHHGKNLRTKDEYQRKLDKDLLPVWGERPISEITRADVKSLLRSKAAESPVAANRLAALIKTLFNWAIDEEIVAASPAARLKREKETPRERTLSDAEIKDVWAGAVALGYPFGHLVRFLLLTGQRRAEAGGLLWPEIDGDEWRLPAERAKTAGGNLVPLSRQARAVLDDCPKFEDVEHVFTARRGRHQEGKPGERRKGKTDESTRRLDQPISGWSKFKRRLDDKILELQRAAAVDAGADPKKVKPLPGWTLHDLRRTCSTGLQSLHVSDDVIDKIQNHALPRVRRHYNHFARDEQKATALAAWGAHVDAIVTGQPAKSNVVTLPASA